MTSTPAVELRVTSLAGSFPLQVGGESSLDVEFMDKILTFDYIFKFILGSEAWGNKKKKNTLLPGASNENIVQNYLNIALLNVL